MGMKFGLYEKGTHSGYFKTKISGNGLMFGPNGNEVTGTEKVT
jgi:hypothetical protein